MGGLRRGLVGLRLSARFMGRVFWGRGTWKRFWCRLRRCLGEESAKGSDPTGSDSLTFCQLPSPAKVWSERGLTPAGSDPFAGLRRGLTLRVRLPDHILGKTTLNPSGHVTVC